MKKLIFFFVLAMLVSGCESGRYLASSQNPGQLKPLDFSKLDQLVEELKKLQDPSGAFFPLQCLDKKMTKGCRREQSLFITAVILEAISGIKHPELALIKSRATQFLVNQRIEHGGELKYYKKGSFLNAIVKSDVDDNALVNGALKKNGYSYHPRIVETMISKAMSRYIIKLPKSLYRERKKKNPNLVREIFKGKIFSTWIRPRRPFFVEKDFVVNLNALWMMGLDGHFESHRKEFAPVCRYISSVLESVEDSPGWGDLYNKRFWIWREQNDFSMWYPSIYTATYSLIRAHRALPSDCLGDDVEKLESMIESYWRQEFWPDLSELARAQAMGTLVELIGLRKDSKVEYDDLVIRLHQGLETMLAQDIPDRSKEKDFYFYGAAGYVASEALIKAYQIKALGFLKSLLSYRKIDSSAPDPGELNQKIERSMGWLQKEQLALDGSYTKMIEVSSDMYAMHMVFLYQYTGQLSKKSKIVKGLLEYGWKKQNPDSGGIPTYQELAPSGKKEGKGQIDASILFYLANTIAGESEKSERMGRLREFIVQNGGVGAARQLSLPYLALFGLSDFQKYLPSPLLDVLLGLNNQLPWIKAILYPMYYVYSSGNIALLEKEQFPFGIMSDDSSENEKIYNSYSKSVLKLHRRKKKKLKKSQRKFFKWMVEHTNPDGTFFDYTPTTIPALLAYWTRADYSNEYKQIVLKGIETLESFQVSKPGGDLFQSPGEASIGETYFISIAQMDALSKLEERPAYLDRAIEFLLSKQQKDSGGFGFSKNNLHFPDSDDVSNVIYTLQEYLDRYRKGLDEKQVNRIENAIGRALENLLTFQNSDGGFATWEKESFSRFYRLLERLGVKPKLVLSESIIEHTARIVFCLGKFRDREPRFQAAYQRALAWLLKKQITKSGELKGAWAGTWFVDYLFGSSMVLSALSTAQDKPQVKQASQLALDFIFKYQRADGGFSESPESFVQKKVIALPGKMSSPAQTGLIVSQILTFFKVVKDPEMLARYREKIENAISFLMSTQTEAGVWNDPSWTGVTFPGIEYLYYPYLQDAAPFHAMALYRRVYLRR